MKLRPNQLCPLHKRFNCCGRDEVTKPWRRNATVRAISRPGVRIVEDVHHPRGYRELCSPSELRRRKLKRITNGESCIYCPEPFNDMRDIELCHLEPKGMNGARRDDHETNLGLGHFKCNRENGSKHYGVPEWSKRA